MSVVERIDGRESLPEKPAKSRRLLRTVAAGVAGLFLLTSAFQASYAQSSNEYDDDDDKGGLDTEEIVLIAVGGAAVLGAIFGLLGRGGDDNNEAAQVTRNREELPAGTRVSQLRLVPNQQTVASGTTCVFNLEARGENGKWYSVTQRPEAAIELTSDGSPLVRMNGAKNAFCLPITAAKESDGRSVRVTGTFAPKGGSPLSAETTVQLAVSGA